MNNSPQSRTWLVTGAAGFIGYNLCRFLISHHQSVIGLDDFSSGWRKNIDRLQQTGDKKFIFHEGSITNPNTIKSIFAQSEKIDVVVHLAAQVSVQKSILEPETTEAINIKGFSNVLEAACSAGVPRFIYASSSAVYGDNQNLPLSETEPLAPTSPYAQSKAANEQMASELAPDATTTIGLRFFNIFGPRQNAESGYAAVVPKWLQCMKGGKRVTIFGDGSATRDYCHVENVCQAIWNISDNTFTPSMGVYNIGTGVATRLNTLFDLISQGLLDRGIVNSRPDFAYSEWRHGDIVHSTADISRARRDFSFNPKIDLRQGISMLLDTASDNEI